MRIIAGSAQGISLKTSPKSTRPTTGLVRGAIFSILESSLSQWERVLDLYAGSGALGIEALSRGAEWADFVEQKAQCCAVIRENVARTRFPERAHVYCVSVKKALTFLTPAYPLIFMDPPYNVASVDGLVREVATSAVVGPGTVLVVPHSRRMPLKPVQGPMELSKERRHGDTLISFYILSPQAGPP